MAGDELFKSGWEKMQAKTFCKWANQHLKVQPLPSCLQLLRLYATRPAASALPLRPAPCRQSVRGFCRSTWALIPVGAPHPLLPPPPLCAALRRRKGPRAGEPRAGQHRHRAGRLHTAHLPRRGPHRKAARALLEEPEEPHPEDGEPQPAAWVRRSGARHGGSQPGANRGGGGGGGKARARRRACWRTAWLGAHDASRHPL